MLKDDEKKEKGFDPMLQEALERFKLAQEAESEIRADCLDDLEFSVGRQWPLNLKSQRERDGVPCLTMDQIQQNIRLVCNQYRQQPPSIQVNPVGNGADVDTAEIQQGLIRHVETISEAQAAYENCHEGVIRVGFDSVRLLTDYVDNESDDQEIYIEKIRNPFSVFWQPGVTQDKANWCFIIQDIPPSEYKDQYSESDLAKMSLDEFTATGNAKPGWVTKEYVRVAEYFTVDEEDQKGKRPKRKVKWRKINAIEELDSRDLPGTSIPVFTAYGDDLDVNGKRYVAGLVRNAKDSQKMVNYWTSKATETIALAPKAPWVAVEGSIAGYEKLYEQANIRNIAVLPYKQVDVAGKPAPPPTRNVVEPPIQGMLEMIQDAKTNLKAAMGLYDPSLGQRKGDESGKAIERLQIQGNVATLNYADNMGRMMRRLGRTLLEWIRVYYDAPKVRRIINPDGTVKQVVTHSGPEDQAAAMELADQEGLKKVWDIGTGKYDVVISVGPTYQSKRQEAVATQIDLLHTLPPNIAPTILDLVVRNMDIPQSKEIADRLKKQLPPNLQDGDEEDPQVQVQKLQAQLQQMGHQHDLLAKALQDTTDAIKTKRVEQEGKVQITALQEQSAQNIEKMKIDAQVAIAEINTKAQNAIERAQMYNEIWKELHGSAHELAMQKDQQSHEAGMAAMGQQADQQSQQADQAHESGMQASDQQAEAASQATDQAHQQQMATQGAE